MRATVPVMGERAIIVATIRVTAPAGLGFDDVQRIYDEALEGMRAHGWDLAGSHVEFITGDAAEPAP